MPLAGTILLDRRDRVVGAVFNDESVTSLPVLTVRTAFEGDRGAIHGRYDRHSLSRVAVLRL